MDSNRKKHDKFRTAKSATSHFMERNYRVSEDLEGPYLEVMKELNYAKDELARLKLETRSALQAKNEAEKVCKVSDRRARMCSSIMEGIKQELQEANEEQALVELARIEAENEAKDIEAKRMTNATHFATLADEFQRKIRHLRSESDKSKELKKMLALTNSDVYALQNEMELIRAMDNNSIKASAIEMEAAKKELAALDELKFQLMASMDLARAEKNRIMVESEKLNQLVKNTECVAEYLNTKLLKTNVKLKSSSAGNERSTAVIRDLSTALQQMQIDREVVSEEIEVLEKDIEAHKLETDEANLCIETTQARLQLAMEELQAAKASEAMALAGLKTACQKQLRARSISSKFNNTMITISKFEYEYLLQGADAAQTVADKKAEAAAAWIKAIEAGEKEILLKAEIVVNNTLELHVVKERDLETNVDDNAFDLQLPGSKYKSLKANVAQTRRVKTRRTSVSSVRRHSISGNPTCFCVKKRKKVIANLYSLVKGRRIRKVN